MTRLRARLPVMFATLLVLCACATRPINPPITQADPGVGYRLLVPA